MAVSIQEQCILAFEAAVWIAKKQQEASRGLGNRLLLFLFILLLKLLLLLLFLLNFANADTL